MIPEQKTFAIAEHHDLGDVARELDKIFNDGWRVVAEIACAGGKLLVCERRSISADNLNQLQEKLHEQSSFT